MEEMEMKHKINGIELNYAGNDSHQKLVKGVVREAVKILSTYDRSCKISMGFAMSHCKKFLIENFNLNDERDLEDTKWGGKEFQGNKI